MAESAAVAASNIHNSRTSDAAVALDDVVVAFRLADGGVYTAVERATLHVADGEFVAIVGPTGCGKSTLLNVTAGLLAPAAGAVNIFGRSLSTLNRQAGYLFQADALFPWKTAVENVAIGLETSGTPAADARAARKTMASARWARRIRRPLSAYVVRRPAQARWLGPGTDPRSQNPAYGRTFRAARRADAADHG